MAFLVVWAGLSVSEAKSVTLREYNFIAKEINQKAKMSIL